MIETLGIIALVVVAPIWIVFHYLTRMRENRGLTSSDEQMLGDVWENTRRMEDRIVNLESILDAEVPDWRQGYARSSRRANP